MISTNEAHTRDSVGSPMTSPTPSQQQTPSRCELEQALSRELFQDSGMSPDGQSSQRRELDVARSQYLSLKRERSIRPPHGVGRSTTINEMKSGHHPTKMQLPFSSNLSDTKAKIPPPPKRTTNGYSGHGHPKPGAANPLRGQQDSTPPHSTCHPATGAHRPKHGPTQIERPPGSVRPCTEAGELRGRSNVMVNAGGKKCVNRQKEKAPQLKQRPHQPPQRGRGQAKSTAEKRPGNFKRGETVVQMKETPPISKLQQQVCMLNTAECRDFMVLLILSNLPNSPALKDPLISLPLRSLLAAADLSVQLRSTD